MAIKAKCREISFVIVRIVFVDVVYLYAFAALLADAACAIVRDENFRSYGCGNRYACHISYRVGLSKGPQRAPDNTHNRDLRELESGWQPNLDLGVATGASAARMSGAISGILISPEMRFPACRCAHAGYIRF